MQGDGFQVVLEQGCMGGVEVFHQSQFLAVGRKHAIDRPAVHLDQFDIGYLGKAPFGEVLNGYWQNASYVLSFEVSTAFFAGKLCQYSRQSSCWTSASEDAR